MCALMRTDLIDCTAEKLAQMLQIIHKLFRKAKLDFELRGKQIHFSGRYIVVCSHALKNGRLSSGLPCDFLTRT